VNRTGWSSRRDDVYGLALILVVDQVFAYAVVESVRETALQRSISEIDPCGRNLAGTT